MDPMQFYIGGRWRRPNGLEVIEVVNPTTETTIAAAAVADRADVDAAVRAAQSAWADWAATPLETRLGLLERIADGLEARRDELAELICSELGMPLKLCRDLQLGMPVAIFRSTARNARDFAFETRIGNSLVVREPVGVVACISPWNYPLHQIAAKIAPALAAGCTVVVKPSEVTPLNAFALAEVIHAAGAPAGVFNLISGDGPGTGEALVSHPGVDAISFTGSTRAGKRVAELASASVKRVALELGGKSAALVLRGADLQTAVKATVSGAFLNSGQTCAALTRLIVHEDDYEAARTVARAAAAKWTPGDPSDPATRLGPLVSAHQREQVLAHVRAGLAQGVDVVLSPDETPTPEHGYFAPPVVFGRVDPASPLAQEEIFGPVLSILTYRDEDEGVRIANDSIYGLSGAVWAADKPAGERAARRLRTGQVAINGGAFNIEAPFGGYKQSGLGRENGRFGLEEYLETKAIQT